MWTCNDSDCDCPTETDADDTLGIVRTGFQANTSPSVDWEGEDSDHLHVLAMEDATCNPTGDVNVALHEWVFTDDFATTLAEKSVATDANCDTEWTHGLIRWGAYDDVLFAGRTAKATGVVEQALRCEAVRPSTR